MNYEEIRKTIENDYSRVAQAKGGERSAREFYHVFSKALEELHYAVGPFVISKEMFIDYIKHLETSVSKDVYAVILDYCKKTLKLDIK